MLGLPESTELRRQIPKDRFFAQLGIKGADRSRFDGTVHSVVVGAMVSPQTVNLDAGAVGCFYVIEVQLKTRECPESVLRMLDRMGHKAVYLLTHGEDGRLAVVEDAVFQGGWAPYPELRLELTGLTVDDTWANIVRSIGNLPDNVPLNEAIAEYKRVSKIDREIESLEARFRKEKQNHTRREIYEQIQALKKQRDTGP